MTIYFARTLTIPSGSAQNPVGVDLSGFTLMGIFVPAQFDGASLTLQAAIDVNGTYVDVQSAGATYTIATTASRYVPIENLAVVAGIQFLKITANTNQTTTSTVFTLALRQVL